MVELFRNVKVDWLGKRKLFFGISIALMVVGMVSLVTKGSFRYGVDFKGGNLVTVRFQERLDVEHVRDLLQKGGVPNAQIQELRGNPGVQDLQIEFGLLTGEADADQAADMVSKALSSAYAEKFMILEKRAVGPKIGADLRRGAIFATLYALAGMLVYIALRFEWIYGAAAVFAVFHDALVTLGFFSLFDREINLTVIAALLTLVGYSVNDTIVVFDRVRENSKVRRRDALEEILNDSINQTLSRTILTSGLTFLTVMALFLFGGEILNHFAFAMVVGILIGSYSSIAVASPLVLIYSNMRGARAR